MTAALLWTCDSWSPSKDFTILVFINPEMAWDQPIWHPGSHQRQQCHSCNQWRSWSGVASAPVFWQMSLSESPSATAFILKYCADLQQMLESSVVWRCIGMDELSEGLFSEWIFHLLHSFSFSLSLTLILERTGEPKLCTCPTQRLALIQAWCSILDLLRPYSGTRFKLLMR